MTTEPSAQTGTASTKPVGRQSINGVAAEIRLGGGDVHAPVTTPEEVNRGAVTPADPDEVDRTVPVIPEGSEFLLRLRHPVTGQFMFAATSDKRAGQVSPPDGWNPAHQWHGRAAVEDFARACEDTTGYEFVGLERVTPEAATRPADSRE